MLTNRTPAETQDTPPLYRTAIRHRGPCGPRRHCWRPECRRRYDPIATLELLPAVVLARCQSACRCPWPAEAEYRIAGRVEPVIVLGLAPFGEVRVVRADGSIGRVAEHRVTLRREAAA